MEGGVVLVSGYMRRQMFNMKCPRKVESDRPLGQVMDCLVGIIQRDVIGARENQETWIPLSLS